VVGDFNGDGKLDVAYFAQVGTFGSNGYLTVDLGNGDGTFQVPYKPLPQPNSVIGPVLEGDFNGDGKLDLVLGNQVFYGKGDGSFTPLGSPSNGLQVIQVGDFNGDGKTDLLALGSNPNNSNQFDIRLLLQIPAPPDFGGGVTPTMQTVVPGSSVNYAGTVTSLNGFTGNVALSASGLPAGVTANFNPTTVTGGSGSYTLTVSAASSVPLGTYSITVTGTSGSLTHSAPVTLVVNSSAGDFSGSVASNSDAFQNINCGQTATYIFQITPTGGFTGNVTMSVSGTPPGSTATFNPSTVAGGSGTTTLTVATAACPNSLYNTYTLTVTATSGPLAHNGNVFLGARGTSGDFTGSITPSSQSITVGQSATYTANISYVNGFSPGSCLNLSVSGLPPGAQFNLISATPCGSSTGESQTFTISAPPGTARGTYTLLIIGSGGGRIRAGAFALTIN
jgi:VCBS repeat-containing protein